MLIDFETAALVFSDENRIVLYEEKHSEYEDRYKTIGSINGFVTVITVIYSVRSKSIRIISARKADRKEKEQYYGKKEMDIKKKPTEEQQKMLRETEETSIIYDDDCPELTEEELAQFRRISDIRNDERRKQTISLRLSPQAIKKAKSLGKGYTSVLSRMLEADLNNNERIKQFL